MSNQPKVSWRCDEIIMQVVVRGYDEQGRAVTERVSQPMKVFRGATGDVWAEVDAQVEAAVQAANQPAPTAGASSEPAAV